MIDECRLTEDLSATEPLAGGDQTQSPSDRPDTVTVTGRQTRHSHRLTDPTPSPAGRPDTVTGRQTGRPVIVSQSLSSNNFDRTLLNRRIYRQMILNMQLKGITIIKNGKLWS